MTEATNPQEPRSYVINPARRVHIYNYSQSNYDQTARMHLSMYYQWHIFYRRQHFLEFLQKSKQPLKKYQAFIVVLNDGRKYFKTLKQAHRYLLRRRMVRATIIRLWKTNAGLHFACAPDIYTTVYKHKITNDYAGYQQAISNAYDCMKHTLFIDG